MYNGLTTADKGALLDAKARGAEWAARDGDDGTLYFYIGKPHKSEYGEWWACDDGETGHCLYVNTLDLPFIQWNDPEPVNIDLALAQIAEMESKQNNLLSEKASEKPCMTWNERINQMTVEEKAKWLINFTMLSCESWCAGFDPFVQTECGYRSSCDNECERHMAEYLASPYTKGEKENG